MILITDNISNMSALEQFGEFIVHVIAAGRRNYRDNDENEGRKWRERERLKTDAPASNVGAESLS